MEYIDKPFHTKKLDLNNRLVLPPMASATAEDNKVSEETIRHYEKRAEGGHIGLLIVEHLYISRDGIASAKQLSLAEDSDIEGFTKLAEAVHRHGSKIVAQLNHAGAAANARLSACPTLGPSENTYFNPEQEMTGDDIRRVAVQFAKAAERAVKAGFDGVEIHSAHGYLLNQFYSPLTNQRADEYGGNLENRVRFHLEVIKAVRAAVGEEFPLLLRLGACDYIEGGNTIADGAAASALFEKAGVDILDISGGLCSYRVKGREDLQGYFQDSSHAIKQAVNIPLILTGGVTDINAADRLIAEGKADLIGVGRALFNDADWAKKAFSSK